VAVFGRVGVGLKSSSAQCLLGEERFAPIWPMVCPPACSSRQALESAYSGLRGLALIRHNRASIEVAAAARHRLRPVAFVRFRARCDLTAPGIFGRCEQMLRSAKPLLLVVNPDRFWPCS